MHICLFVFFACAIAVGGLTSPLRGPYAEPLYFSKKPPDNPPLNQDSPDCDAEQRNPTWPGITAATDSENLSYPCEETGAEESKPRSLRSPQISEPNHKRSSKTTVPELELRKLERGSPFSHYCISSIVSTMFANFWLDSPASVADFYLTSLSQLHSAEMQEQLLSCLSSDPYSNWEPWDKKVTESHTHILKVSC